MVLARSCVAGHVADDLHCCSGVVADRPGRDARRNLSRMSMTRTSMAPPADGPREVHGIRKEL